VVSLLGLGPAILLCLALAREWQQQTGRATAVALGLALIVAGPLFYWLAIRFRRKPSPPLDRWWSP